MWWPFRRRPAAVEADEAIQLLEGFHDARRYYERAGGPYATRAQHQHAKDCLRLMLHREPTDAEAKAVYDPDIPL